MKAFPRKFRTRFLVFLFPLAVFVLAGTQQAFAAARAPKHSVTNQYHGVSAIDDYQWLEKSDDPAVKRWTQAQSKEARATLDKIQVRPWVEEPLQRLPKTPSTNY